jgi:hypothetical protein
MTRFRDIVLNEEEGTVEFGAGLTWKDLFSYLVPKGLNVVGGRLDVVGVAGFILGGGRHFSRLLLMHMAPRWLIVIFTCQDIRGRPISTVSQ